MNLSDQVISKEVAANKVILDEPLDIPGYEGLYCVYKDGSVWSYPKTQKIHNYTRTYKHRRLKETTSNTGYQSVHLYKNSKGKRISIHRLVAITYLKNPQKLPCVHHIDSDRKNNCIDNLMWVTYKQNINFKGYVKPWNKGKSIKCNNALEEWRIKGNGPWNKGLKLAPSKKQPNKSRGLE